MSNDETHSAFAGGLSVTTIGEKVIIEPIGFGLGEKKFKEDLHIMYISDYEALKAEIEELKKERDEFEQKGINLCCELGNNLLERDQLRADLKLVVEALNNIAENEMSECKECERIRNLAKDNSSVGILTSIVVTQSENDAPIAERDKLRAELTGCEERLGEYIVEYQHIHKLKADLKLAVEALKYYANHESIIVEAYHSNEEKQITCVHGFINHKAKDALAKLQNSGGGE